MTRLGWLLLLAFLIVIGGFVAVTHQGRGPVTAVSRQTTSAPAPAPAQAIGTAPAVASAAPAAPAGVAAGGLVVPVSGVQPGQLTDTWGDARGDGTRAHHAIDIMAPRGTPVVAAAAGTVEKIFESKAGGHTVYVRRRDPAIVDYYAHLDSYAPGLAEGMAVAQGQLIATVGSSGDADASAPHLHYEIKAMKAGEGWWQGTEIDPYPILAGRPANR